MPRRLICALTLVLVAVGYRHVRPPEHESASFQPQPAAFNSDLPATRPPNEHDKPASPPDVPSEQQGADIAELVSRLKAGDILDRQAAARALAACGQRAEEAVPALADALHSPSLHRPAIEALLAIGPRGRQVLISLSRTDPNLLSDRVLRTAEGKVAAFRALGKALDENWDALVPLARFDIERYKQHLAGFVVGTDPFRVPPTPLSLPLLIRALRAPDPYMRMLAAERLEQLGPIARPAIDHLIAMLEDPWPLQDPEPRGLGGYGYDSGPTFSVRIAAVKALLAIGDAAEEPLQRDGVAHLSAGLHTDSLDVRLHTTRALVLLGPRALPAAPHLVEELRAVTLSERRLRDNPFAEALFAMGPRMMAELLPLLDDANANVQREALRVISDLGTRARPYARYVRALLDKAPEHTRSHAAGVLARIAPDDPVTVPTLIEVAKRDRCWEAMKALGRLGPRARAAVPALEVLLGDERFTYRALNCLREIGLSRAELAAKLADAYRGNPTSTPDWVRTYGNDKAAAQFLIEKLRTAPRRDPARPPQLRGDNQILVERLRAAGELRRRFEWAERLVMISPDYAEHVLPVFLEFLDVTPDKQIDDRTYPTLFERSLSALRYTGPAAAAAVPILLKRLDDPKGQDNGRQHQDIVRTLIELGPVACGAVPAIRLRLQQEDALPWAAPLLARIAPTDTAVIPALTTLLAYRERDDRRTAAEELGRLGLAARQAVPRLVHALTDEAAEVRMFASAALIRITGDQDRYAPCLRRALRDTPSAARALGTFGRDWPWTAEALRDTLRRPAREVNPEDVRNGSFHPPRPVAVAVQYAAAYALSGIGPSARIAMPELIRILQEESLRPPSSRAGALAGACATALGAIGPEAQSALPILYHFALGDDWGIGDAAREAVARIEGRQP